MTLFLMLIFASAADAQLADLYANFSKATYETFHECPKLKLEDFSQGKDSCRPTNSGDNVGDLAQVNEEVFFAGEAQEEMQNLTCTIQRTAAIEKNPEALQAISANMADKINLAIPLYKELQDAKADWARQETQARGKLRSLNYNSAVKKAEAANEVVDQLERALAAIAASAWHGDSRTISNYFMAQVRSGNKREIPSTQKVNTAMPHLARQLRAEYEKNQKSLSAEKKSATSWNLSTESKKMLLQKAQANNYFATKFSDSPALGRGLECRLEGKYGKGQEYADNIVLAGTLVASGGSALLARGAFALRATVARGVSLGRVSEQAGNVMLKAAMGLNAGTALADIDKHCLSQKQDFNTQKNLCSGDTLELVGGEIQNLEQGNCVLAVALSGAPLPIIAAAGKAMSGLKMPGLLSSFVNKGDDFLSRKGSPPIVSNQDLSKYSNESQEYLKSLGVQTERVTSDTLPNFDKINKSARLESLKKQLAEQENSLSVVEEKMGTESMQSAMYGSGQITQSGEEAAFEKLLQKAKPLNREENLKSIRNEIAALEKELSTAPDKLSGSPVNAVNTGLFGIRVEGNLGPQEVFKVTKLPPAKGKAAYDTPALMHPQMQKDIDELQRLGVDLRIDPSLKAVDDRSAFYFDSPLPNTPRAINISAATPYEVFKHEKTHALFSHYIKPKLAELNAAVKEGRSIESVLTAEEIQGFGKSNLKSLEKNLKRDNTELALNERIAVDAQLKEMGLMRFSPTAVDTEAYGLRHQLDGYQKIYQKNENLTARQQMEYLKIVAKAGALVSYQEGAQEAQKFMRALATPSAQNAQALARKLSNLQEQKQTSQSSYFFDTAGRLLVLKADGTWQRFDTK